MKMYHATSYRNLPSILESGVKTGPDGIIYMCQKPEEAIRFLAIRGERDILVVEANINKRYLKETFDHSERFFKCRAFGYSRNIGSNLITNYIRYQL